MKIASQGVLAQWLLAGSALFVEAALQRSNGEYNTRSLVYISIAALCALISIVKPDWERLDRLGDWPLTAVLLGFLAWNIGVELTTPPGINMEPTPPVYTLHHLELAFAAVLIGVLATTEKRVRASAFVGLLVVGWMLGDWMIHATPRPRIDVWAWHIVSFDAFRHGVNPYAIDMPNIYGHTLWYAPGLADATKVFVGFPYPPLTFLVGLVGDTLGGDYRYANLFGIVVGCALLGFSRNTRLSHLAAAAMFFSTRTLFILEQGWTEMTVILMVGIFAFTACRLPRLLPYALGLLIAVKQYAIFTVPLALLVMPPVPKEQRLKIWGRFVLKTAIVVAVLNLPFFLWSPSDFIRSAVVFQSKQPFRYEALSFMAHFFRQDRTMLPNWLSFALAIVGVAIALFRASRTPGGFLAGFAFVLLLFFAVAKQAFCNYYFIIEALFFAALAVSAIDVPRAASAASRADTA